jgi:hypothetical protein
VRRFTRTLLLTTPPGAWMPGASKICPAGWIRACARTYTQLTHTRAHARTHAHTYPGARGSRAIKDCPCWMDPCACVPCTHTHTHAHTRTHTHAHLTLSRRRISMRVDAGRDQRLPAEMDDARARARTPAHTQSTRTLSCGHAPQAWIPGVNCPCWIGTCTRAFAPLSVAAGAGMRRSTHTDGSAETGIGGDS